IGSLISIDLCNKVRNGLVQELAVYRGIELSEDKFAEAQVLCFDDELHFCPVVVDRLKPMIVVNGKPKEIADPLPVAVWDKLSHGEPSLNAVCKMENTNSGRRKFTGRFNGHTLDMLGPTWPCLNPCQMLPCALKGHVNNKFTLDQT